VVLMDAPVTQDTAPIKSTRATYLHEVATALCAVAATKDVSDQGLLARNHVPGAQHLTSKYALSDLLRGYCTLHNADGVTQSAQEARPTINDILRHLVSPTALVEAIADIADSDPATARLLVSDVLTPLQRDLYGPRNVDVGVRYAVRLVAAPMRARVSRDPYGPIYASARAAGYYAKGTNRMFRSPSPGRLTRAMYLELFGIFAPSRSQYLEAQLVRAKRSLSKDQISFARVLSSDWAGTLQELIDTVRELRPPGPRRPKRKFFQLST
jgi:hypothetical protein